MATLLDELAAIAAESAAPAMKPKTALRCSEKIKLLDNAPLCAVVLDGAGRAKEINRLFEELMGPLYKFANFGFAQSAATDDGKATLGAAIARVHSGASKRERLRNLEMLTLAGDAGLPIKSHFDWFIGASDSGEVVLYGDACSDDLLEQREKDAELIDFFQNAPIAMHWLSGTGHVMWANQTELDVLGYTAEEYIGQPIMKFCPDEEELVLEIFKTLGSGNIIKDVPVRIRARKALLQGPFHPRLSARHHERFAGALPHEGRQNRTAAHRLERGVQDRRKGREGLQPHALLHPRRYGPPGARGARGGDAQGNESLTQVPAI